MRDTTKELTKNKWYTVVYMTDEPSKCYPPLGVKVTNWCVFEKDMDTLLSFQPESKDTTKEESWEEEFWKLVDNEGVGADIRFVQHLKDFIRKEKQKAFLEIIEFLDELEIRQPEDLKTDNWRNWKYIRNSIVDKYALKEEGEK